jgi:hypothetical protein
LKVCVERWPLSVPGESQNIGGGQHHAVYAVGGVGVLQHVHLGDFACQHAREHDVIAIRRRKIVEEWKRGGRVPVGDEKKIQIDPIR